MASDSFFFFFFACDMGQFVHSQQILFLLKQLSKCCVTKRKMCPHKSRLRGGFVQTRTFYSKVTVLCTYKINKLGLYKCYNGSLGHSLTADGGFPVVSDCTYKCQLWIKKKKSSNTFSVHKLLHFHTVFIYIFYTQDRGSILVLGHIPNLWWAKVGPGALLWADSINMDFNRPHQWTLEACFAISLSFSLTHDWATFFGGQ